MPPKARELFWARKAQEDVDSLWRYFENVASPDVADRLHSNIVAAASRLCDRPYIGRPRDEFRHGLRSLRVDAYAIYYLIREDSIIIVRVLHERRDAQEAFREK